MPDNDTVVKEVGVPTQHQLSEQELNSRDRDLTDIDLPFTVENVTLMSPGTWNGKQYRLDEIRSAYERTDWDDVDVRALFNEHDDHDSRDWIGEVRNVRMDGEELVADMDVVTADEARKLAYGARFGISPKVSGLDRADVMHDFSYDNFSLVLDPAVKTTYLNSEHKTDDDNEDDVQGVKNVKVKSTMSDKDSKELSSEEKEKISEIVSTVENSDVKELAEVISPFMGGRNPEELQSHIETVVENSGHEDDEEDMEEDGEYSEHDKEAMMRDMEKIAREAAESVVAEMGDDESGEDTSGDEGDSAEESLSADEIAEKVAEAVQIENSQDEDGDDDENEEVDALKEELSEIKEQLESSEDEDKTTVENKTPNPGSQSTGADEGSGQKDVQEMSDKEIDTAAAKYMLRTQRRRIR